MTMTSISGRVILRFPNRTKEKWLRFTPHQRSCLPTTQTPPHTASAGAGQDDVDDDENDNDNDDDFDDDDAPALATLKRRSCFYTAKIICLKSPETQNTPKIVTLNIVIIDMSSELLTNKNKKCDK